MMRSVIKVFWLGMLIVPSIALAQGGDPANSYTPSLGASEEDVSGMVLMVSAYGLLWVLLLAYVVRLGFLHAATVRNLERIEKTLADGTARSVAQSDARTESDH